MPANIEQALRGLEQGKFVIVIDEAEDCNTGDLIIAAEFASAEVVNYMMTTARGLLSVALTGERLDELGLPLMAADQLLTPRSRSARTAPAFTVSVDAAEGITSGDSAADRAATIRLLLDGATRPQDLLRPGHVFPIRAAEGGTLARVGHTEAAVDLARLAGLYPAGLLCQILNPDGTAADMAALQKLAETEGLQIVTIADIIRLRRRTEHLVKRQSSAYLPTKYGDFEAVIYTSELDGSVYVAIVKGDPKSCETPLVRVHSGCITGDILGSLKCDCGWQLHAALEAIEEAGCGVVLYIPGHEGRGIGLVNKIMAYHLQEQGYDTVEANEALGFPGDMRDYGLGAQVLADLGVTSMKLMTNNPAKFTAMDGYGLHVVERVPLVAPPCPYSADYMRTKQEKMGHMLDESDQSADSSD